MLVFIVVLICISLMTSEFGKFPYILGHLIASFVKHLLKSLAQFSTTLCIFFLLIHRNSLPILERTPLSLFMACPFYTLNGVVVVVDFDDQSFLFCSGLTLPFKLKIFLKI